MASVIQEGEEAVQSTVGGHSGIFSEVVDTKL